ncbi:MAG: hypothetical protein KGJ78_05085 [Alphaproteobacteria bacterium]|nr:hypothetical protein [Alphaproteobacteria bacterium]
MSERKPAAATMIQPGAYPVMSSAAAMGLMRALRDPETSLAAARVIADHAAELRTAVLAHIDRVEEVAQILDPAAIYEQAHEIRGLAGNAGLAATGRISNVLCRYLDAVMRAGKAPQRGVVALHLEAIARAAHAEDEATRLGDAVANELSQLVDRKLAEINESDAQR